MFDIEKIVLITGLLKLFFPIPSLLGHFSWKHWTDDITVMWAKHKQKFNRRRMCNLYPCLLSNGETGCLNVKQNTECVGWNWVKSQLCYTKKFCTNINKVSTRCIVSTSVTETKISRHKSFILLEENTQWWENMFLL